MNPTTGNDILAYQGNVGLGLNADPGAIGVYGDTDLKDANSSLFNLSYLNMQKNKAVWDQKLKDRDAAMSLIADGKLAVKNALPKDRERLLKMIEDVKKTFFDNNGDVKSDPRVWLKINDQLAKFNEGSTTAASRYLSYTNGIAEAAKETNPIKKNKMMEHWQGQLGRDLYEPMDPYQQSLDWDNKKVFRPMQDKVTQLGVDGYNRLTETRTDLPKSYRDFVNAYQQGDDQELGLNVDTFLNSFYGQDGILTPDAVQAKAQQVNDRLKKIAISEGYNPDEVDKLPDYLKPLNPRLINGKIQSNDYKWNDWFKIMLYDQYKVKKDSVYDKDLAAGAKIKSEIDQNKAQGAAALIRANAYKNAQGALAGKYRAATKQLDQQTTPAQNFDELKTKTKTIKGPNGYVTQVNWDDLQTNTRTYLGVDPLTTGGGKNRFVNVVPTKIVVKNNGKDETINDGDVEKYYKQALDKGYQGSMIDYLNSVGASYDIEVIGREKGKKEIQRSGRLSSYQNQTKDNKMNKSSLFLEEDNTPDEIDE